MSYSIHVLPDDIEPGVANQIRKAAQCTLDSEQAQPGTLSIVLTDDAEVQTLNRTYLGLDEPTDVLAFPDGSVDPEEGALYFGDIIISLPAAKRQSQRLRHDLDDELKLLVVHGALHLLGYDHAEETDKAEMWAAQQSILDALHVQIIMNEVGE
jgi:probable rRNA maturation factor